MLVPSFSLEITKLNGGGIQTEKLDRVASFFRIAGLRQTYGNGLAAAATSLDKQLSGLA